jgi:hypothetical protein
MLINAKAFDGLTRHFDTLMMLQGIYSKSTTTKDIIPN